ncbi:MAG: FAD-binding oxidoreductase [Rhodobacteraceae bacterium]|nr:FAD-binding oxidoreductase [Paracoccaceae bacterium]
MPETPPEKTEILIIGAGYTGLSAAITAAREGAKITVIDAMVPGQGASTRNGGMIGAHARVAVEAITAAFGRDTAIRLVNEAPKAYAFTRRLIADEGIDCDFIQTGRVVLDSTQTAFDQSRRLAEALHRLAGYDMQVIEKPDLGAHIATDAYKGGVYYPDHGGLHPRKFHDGLMRVALGAGVLVVQNCPVLSVEGPEGAFLANTASGSIRADKVIFATNGYTGARFGHISRRIFALPSFIIATEKLDAGLIARLAPGLRMMVETRARHSYFRISPDGSRILFGGRAGMVPYGPVFAAMRLRDTMVGIWPELKDAAISHSWRGNTGFTFQQMPHVGSHNGRHFAFGYSGSGVALAPYLGMKVAYQALGDQRGDTAYSETVPTTRIWYSGGRPLFLIAGEVWYRQVVDRWEGWQARK